MRSITIVHEQPKDENEVHITKITDLVDGSVDELIVNDAIDYISNRIDGLRMLVDKLRYGGTIEVRGVDILEIARGLYTCQMNIAQANSLIHDNRQSCDSIIGVVGFLQNFGLEIISKQVGNFSYFVQAKRKKVDE